MLFQPRLSSKTQIKIFLIEDISLLHMAEVTTVAQPKVYRAMSILFVHKPPQNNKQHEGE